MPERYVVLTIETCMPRCVINWMIAGWAEPFAPGKQRLRFSPGPSRSGCNNGRILHICALK
jgi:hypothetical protein